jgi:tellurite methyltransferase
MRLASGLCSSGRWAIVGTKSDLERCSKAQFGESHDVCTLLRDRTLMRRMTTNDAERWNTRYLEEGQSWLKRAPRPLLLEYTGLLPRCGLALDAAAGVAVNGLFLAELGMHVIALDVSEVGLRLALSEAEARSLQLDVAVTDLLVPWLPPDCLDVIVNFRFFGRAIISQYRRALKSGGLLFFETFLRDAGVLSHPEYYPLPGEMKKAFANWEMIHWSTEEKRSRGSGFPRVTERLVVRKPIHGA